MHELFRFGRLQWVLVAGCMMFGIASGVQAQSPSQALPAGGKVLLDYTLKEFGKSEIPFCWKRSASRSSSPLTCRPGEDQTAGPLGQCYPACQSGYVGWHTVCKQPCPAGYRDDGLTCFRDAHIFGNGCAGNCPAGYTNDGCTCRRDAHAFAPGRYDRGTGHAVDACPAGMTRNGALCYAACSAGYTPTSDVDLTCWQSCQSYQPTDCAAGCTIGSEECAENVVDMVIAPLEFAANVALLVGTGGAGNAAKTALKSTLKTGTKAAIRAAARAAINTIKDTILRKLRTKVEAKLLRSLARDQAEAVLQAAAESLAVSALAQDFDLEGLMVDLDPTGIAAIVDAYNEPLCDPAENPPSVDWNTGSPAAVFWLQDTNRAQGVSDWDPQHYKATCAASEGVVGVSTATANGIAHAALCAPFGLNSVQIAVLGTGREQRRASRLGDWDPSHFKAECGLGEFISGLSQTPGTGALHAVRCSRGAGSNQQCERRLVDGGAGHAPELGDWDLGYFKAGCPAGKVAVGASQKPGSTKVHALLCCSP